jgi:hypothetical protein
MKIKFIAAVLTALGLALGLSGLVFAHGHAPQVGDYDIVIGFHNEPAVQGQPNGLDLFVTNVKTQEKVNGLEDTLQAEISFGSSKKTLKISPQEDLDGAYTAFVIPSAAGKYTWRIFGKINEQAVDVSMTSGPDTFGEVEPQADYLFPAGGSSTSDAGASAQTALLVGGLGVALGLAGLLVGLTARRRA